MVSTPNTFSSISISIYFLNNNTATCLQLTGMETKKNFQLHTKINRTRTIMSKKGTTNSIGVQACL